MAKIKFKTMRHNQQTTIGDILLRDCKDCIHYKKCEKKGTVCPTYKKKW